MAQVANGMVMDIRGVTPSMRRPLVFSVIDRLIELECDDSVVVICVHADAVHPHRRVAQLVHFTDGCQHRLNHESERQESHP